MFQRLARPVRDEFNSLPRGRFSGSDRLTGFCTVAPPRPPVGIPEGCTVEPTINTAERALPSSRDLPEGVLGYSKPVRERISQSHTDGMGNVPTAEPQCP